MRREVRGMRRQRSQGWGSLLIALLLLLVLAPVVAHAQGADSVSITWTAPGDDGSVGTAASYELRMSTSAITAANWGGATVVAGTPTPGVAGTREHVVVRGLTNGTPYWFAIKTTDDSGNQSNISNVLLWNWVLDTTAPAAPLGVSATAVGGASVQVSWTANAEPDLQGYAVYRTLVAGGSFTQVNGSLVSGTQYVDAVPVGTATAWYQVSAQDASGNVSARSATVAVDLTSVTQTGTEIWSLATGYPNPSGAGVVVRLPVVSPSGGGSAVLEILSSGGQRVRRQAVDVMGGVGELQWDGKNDAGREVAPGVYTAWLIAGGSRMSVRLVRVP
jgi:hypothetical protein